MAPSHDILFNTLCVDACKSSFACPCMFNRLQSHSMMCIKCTVNHSQQMPRKRERQKVTDKRKRGERKRKRGETESYREREERERERMRKRRDR